MKSTIPDLQSVFVDSSAWIALFLDGEEYHQEVSIIYKQFIKGKTKIVTCSYVLDEVYTRLLTVQGYHQTLQFKQFIEKAATASVLGIIWVDELMHTRSWKNFEKYNDHRLSYTDAVITHIVDHFGISAILTLDQGFKNSGYLTMPQFL